MVEPDTASLTKTSLIRLVSPGARFEAFESNEMDVFRKDLVTNETIRVSTSSAGAQSNGGSYGEPALSADGRHIAFPFVSPGTRLDAADRNAIYRPLAEKVGLITCLFA